MCIYVRICIFSHLLILLRFLHFSPIIPNTFLKHTYLHTSAHFFRGKWNFSHLLSTGVKADVRKSLSKREGWEMLRLSQWTESLKNTETSKCLAFWERFPYWTRKSQCSGHYFRHFSSRNFIHLFGVEVNRVPRISATPAQPFSQSCCSQNVHHLHRSACYLR